MAHKLTEIPENWLHWIQQCRRVGSDFDQMKNTLLEHFDPRAVEYWIFQIWSSLDSPMNSEYDLDHSWLNCAMRASHGVEIEYLHTQPTVAVFKQILTDDQCDEIVDHYVNDSRETRAHVYDNNTGGSTIHQARTNKLTAIEYGEHPVVSLLEKRIANVTQLDIRRGEQAQLLHYQIGEQYTPHDDFFHGDKVGSRIRESGQRIATVITYLNNVEQGGETEFPQLGITVAPNKGDALYFEYTDAYGRSTELCRHASLPVIKGEKWAITKWLRLGQAMPDHIKQAYYS